jgi:hypothetical protein
VIIKATEVMIATAFLTAGLQAERQDKTGGLADIFESMGEEMAEWLVVSPDGEETTLQMAYIDRCNSPLSTDIGPVLDVEDLIPPLR